MNKPAWLISLMPPLMSLVIIRTYLGSFDNASLFTENISGADIFNFVFIFIRGSYQNGERGSESRHQN
ncbi:hypothetical protein FHP67_005050 [Escherichia coli]|nr:hypothetical protein [Escherichia coli]